MKSRSVFRVVLWTVVGLFVVAHIGGGWYYSNEIIDDNFLPDPEPFAMSSSDYDFTELSYESPLGQMDAIHLPAGGSTWVIHVHGEGTTPLESEHLFAPLQEAGYPQLAVTYRNDESQPSDPSGYYQYGVTEHEDMSGAMEFAQANGAQAVVFSGFSAGSSHILSFVYKNNLDDIKGLLFDSPNIDFSETVEFQLSMRDLPVLPMQVPSTVTWVAQFFTSLRLGVNWKTLDYVDRAESTLRIPVLIHHGAEDDQIPMNQSLALVEAQPNLVRLVQVPGAGHVGSYQADPDQYIEEVLSFLETIG